MEIKTVGQLQDFLLNINPDTPIVFFDYADHDDHDDEANNLLSFNINIRATKLNFYRNSKIANHSTIDSDTAKESVIISAPWNTYHN